jgi:uncharacterized repeat protein (TIGR03803 family)
LILKRSWSYVVGLSFFSAATGLGIAQTEVVLHSFSGPPKGANPYAGLVRDISGNFYGTAPTGGDYNQGVVYELSTSGRVTVLYSFTGDADGGAPHAAVILDSAGNLYGTTTTGGSANLGVAYELDAAGNETVLHSFAGGTDGATPSSGLTMDASGNLYGTTSSGGSGNSGTVYKLTATGLGTVLYSFTNGADGGEPTGGVVLDPKGNLFGTTGYGGAELFGVVYKLNAAGQETVLYSFTEAGEEAPSGLIRDSKGNLYGTLESYYTGFQGEVYKLNAVGKFSVLYNFTGGLDGYDPVGALVQDSAGNLYGAW